MSGSLWSVRVPQTCCPAAPDGATHTSGELEACREGRVRIRADGDRMTSGSSCRVDGEHTGSMSSSCSGGVNWDDGSRFMRSIGKLFSNV